MASPIPRAALVTDCPSNAEGPWHDWRTREADPPVREANLRCSYCGRGGFAKGEALTMWTTLPPRAFHSYLRGAGLETTEGHRAE